MNKYLYILLFISSLHAKAQYTLSTIAGSGVSLGFSGDGNMATDALLHNPYATAVDKMGNVYIADYLNHRIRKIDTNGTIITVAGSSSTPGYFGDGGLAIHAILNYPAGVAVDETGNVFVADSRNNAIRKIDKDGIISTFANNNLGNPTAVAIDQNNNLFVADYLNHQIKKIDSNGVISIVAGTGSVGYSGDNDLAVNAQLNYPEGVAVDKLGNIYVSDTQNRRVRKITTDGNIISIAGNGIGGYSGDGSLAILAQLNTPKGLACDTLGNVYFADADNNRIRKIDNNGNINTVLGEIGIMASAQLSLPVSVTCDKKGSLYIADTYNSAVRKLTAPNVLPIDETTTIEEIELNSDNFIVYPNPNEGVFFVSIINAAYTNFEVYNMFGQKIRTKLIQQSDTKYSIDMSNEANGLYFVHADKDNQKIVKKINIVKR